MESHYFCKPYVSGVYEAIELTEKIIYFYIFLNLKL